MNVWLGLLGIQWLFRNVALNDGRLLNLLCRFVENSGRDLNPTNRVGVGRSCFTFSIVVRCFSSTIIETIGSLVGNSISILINPIALIRRRPSIINSCNKLGSCRCWICKPLILICVEGCILVPQINKGSVFGSNRRK